MPWEASGVVYTRDMTFKMYSQAMYTIIWRPKGGFENPLEPALPTGLMCIHQTIYVP